MLLIVAGFEICHRGIIMSFLYVGWGAGKWRREEDILRRAEDIRIHGGSYPILSVYCVDFRLQYGNFTSCRLPARVQCSLCRRDIVRFCGAKTTPKKEKTAPRQLCRGAVKSISEKPIADLKRDHLLSLM